MRFSVQVDMCYSVIPLLMGNEKYLRSESTFCITQPPNFEHEGMAGYISTHVKFETRGIYNLILLSEGIKEAIESNSSENYFRYLNLARRHGR